MKCKICKQKTNWDESYGMAEFIVCPRCFEEMAENEKGNFYTKRNKIMNMIFTIGAQIERTNDRNNKKK